MNVLISEDTLVDIADAIREKNGETKLYRPDEMPQAILEIKTSDGTEEVADGSKPIRFYGPYGDLLYSYSLEEFYALEDLPLLPEYDGLICQGWNWTREKILAVNGEVDVGSLFITDDGSTRIYIELLEEALNPKVGFEQSAAHGVSVDWGDGSELETSASYGSTLVSLEHQYQEAGSYVIRLIPQDDVTINLRGDAYNTKLLHKVIGYSNENRVYGSAIKKIELGKGITAFLTRCFNSTTLESVTIPDGITVFATAFQGCSSLKAVTIPRTVKSLPSYAIRDCISLTKLIFSDSALSVSGTAFSGCNALKEVVVPGTVSLNASDLFADCRMLQRAVIHDGVAIMGADMFYQCYALREVMLPQTLTELGGNAFMNCKRLERMEIPDGVESIPSSFLYGCDSLRKLKLPQNLISIGSNAFSGCYSLCEVTIPENVTEIEGSAFSNNPGIERYYLLPTTPPTLSGTNVFSNIVASCKMYVPKGCLEAYQSATYWSTYADYMVEMEE